MSLKVLDVKNIIENFAPVKLKESYDNVGLMVGELDKEVTSILVALDCTLDVIKEASEKGCNLVFTHHPLLFRKPTSITSETLTGKKILELIKNEINVYSAHTNLDSIYGGINDTLMSILGLKDYITMDLSNSRDREDNKSGIGRFATLKEEITLKELCNRVKQNLNISNLRYGGELSKVIKKVAVVNGSGQDYFAMAKKMKADCIITGDTSYHYVSDYVEENIAIIDAGHFGTEWPAFKAICEKLNEELEKLGFADKMEFSKVCKDPFNFY